MPVIVQRGCVLASAYVAIFNTVLFQEERTKTQDGSLLKIDQRRRKKLKAIMVFLCEQRCFKAQINPSHPPQFCMKTQMTVFTISDSAVLCGVYSPMHLVLLIYLYHQAKLGLTFNWILFMQRQRQSRSADTSKKQTVSANSLIHNKLVLYS